MQRGQKGRGGDPTEHEFDRKVIDIRRVAKVRAGAKRLRFSVMVAVGDKKGKVGVAVGRGVDTRAAINKGAKQATNSMTKMDLMGDTIPHDVYMKFRGAKLIMRPAGPGTGVIASGPVRAVMEAVGVKNVLTKQLGSDNPLTNTYCAFEALKSLNKTRILAKRSEKLRSKLSSTKDEAASNTTKKK